MQRISVGATTGAVSGAEPALRAAGFGFLFWAAFLLALDPDLLFGEAGGWLPAVTHDAGRILSASVLGGAMAMVQSLLVVRFRVGGGRRIANLPIHVAACFGLALAAIAIANVGAPLVLPPDSPRLGQSLGQDIANNLVLMAFALGVFSALLHLIAKREDAQLAPQFAQRIATSTRSGVVMVDAAAVDWIEAQGNYAALHVDGATHLVRETLTGLLRRLDPARFVRIHRGAIINIEHMKRLKPLSSGDAVVEMQNGSELRASRTYAGALRQLLAR